MVGDPLQPHIGQLVTFAEIQRLKEGQGGAHPLQGGREERGGEREGEGEGGREGG